MTKRKNIHPGEILLEEFLIPFEITAYKLVKDVGIPQRRVSEILKGNRRITADSALRLSKYFGNSAKFWLGINDDYDLEEEANAGFRIKCSSAYSLPDNYRVSFSVNNRITDGLWNITPVFYF